MTNSKTTKSALFSSAVALLLCFTMLLGTTFAWFTDSASTAVNTIQSGNLDIVVSYALQSDVVNGAIPDDAWKEINETTPVFSPDALWEPGYTEVAYFKFENKGSLALKYLMSSTIVKEISGTNKAGEEFKLSEYLTAYQMTADTVTIYSAREGAQDPLGGFAAMFPNMAPANLADAAIAEVSSAKALSYETALEAGETLYTTMVIFMPTTVGNEANHNGVDKPSIQLGINILATQYTSETDSYDDQYDKDAQYPELPDKWDGTADTSWYNDTDTEFVLTTAEQVVGFAELVDAGNNFAGKTIKLEKDLDLGATDANGDPICFEPIGGCRSEAPFMGTFDGQGHTISNMSQNTWALNNGYYYSGELGIGFFGGVEDAVIKNLVVDGAEISGESALCGAVAGVAMGDCTFENITVKNANVNDYLYGAGGIVGWASGNQTYKGITVDETTVVGSQWGDFGNANGGIIGQAQTSGTYHFEDCTIACRIDATNDIVSAYQWYCYRNSGMIIGKVDDYVQDEVKDVIAENVTCDNVTVIYNDWANYTYCEFAGTGYPYVRVQAGVSVDAYSNARYGHPTDANGNTVVDDNHVHNDGEDHQLLLVFDQLFGGPANDRHCYYGIAQHPGVTVIYNNK